MNSTYIYIAYIFLFLSAFLLFFEIHKKFEENKVITRVINKYKDDLDKRIDMEAAFVSEYGSIENKSIFYKHPEVHGVAYQKWFYNAIADAKGMAKKF